MSWMSGFGRPQPSSAEKIAAAETELDMVSDMFNRSDYSLPLSPFFKLNNSQIDVLLHEEMRPERLPRSRAQQRRRRVLRPLRRKVLRGQRQGQREDAGHIGAAGWWWRRWYVWSLRRDTWCFYEHEVDAACQRFDNRMYWDILLF